MTYNDSSFHQLWVPLLANEEIHMFYENFDGNYPASNHENQGRDQLREAFAVKWLPRTPLFERFSNSPDAAALLKAQHTVLAGGPVSNIITREYLNRFTGIDWIVDYERPERESVFMLHKPTGRHYEADYHGVTLRRDLAVLTVATNPYNADKRIISCAGVHSEGTRGLLSFLAAPHTAPWLFADVLRHIHEPILQVPVWVNCTNFEVSPFTPEPR